VTSVKQRKILCILILFLILISTVICQGIKIESYEKSERFFLWATSDSHGYDRWDDDISFDGTTWSGSMIQEGVERIDYGFIAGDILLVGGSSYSHFNYLNNTCSCLLPNRDMSSFWSAPADERIWGFCIGNHEEYNGGCTSAAKGLGLDSTVSWYNNEVVMGNSYNYTALRGNLLFIYMGGDRNSPYSYKSGLSTPGDFYWFKDQVEWADDNNVNVIAVTHMGIFNSSNSLGFPLGYTNNDVYYDVETSSWKACNEHFLQWCDFDDPWPGDNHWSECDDFWNLIDTYGNINLWFNGHTHTASDSRDPPPHKHAGWDTIYGVDRDIQKSKDCTFVNCAGTGPWGDFWSFSRVGIFTEDSKDIEFKSFDHDSNSYGHETGWKSSHQDIIITDCLKYPFDPNFKPSNNAPYKPEKPTGETNGQTGKEYEYSTKTIDPEGDKVFYLFSWSDGDDTGWLGPYNSGEECKTSHIWENSGAYVIKVKAKDEHGIEGPWSDLLPVTMPRTKKINSLIFYNMMNYLFSSLIG